MSTNLAVDTIRINEPSRREKVLAGLNLAGKGLEIGAGYNPTLTKAEGYDVETLDHADQATIVAKYRADGHDTSRVQPVDYIWSGQPYLELVDHKQFDWIIASHVIEHVPDLIGFVNQCSDILTDAGVLSLAIPDKRYIFDHYRPVSGLGSVIDAHLAGRKISSPGLAIEYYRNSCHLNGICWDRATIGVPNFIHPIETAKKIFQDIVENKIYHDIHAWTFTPASFRLMLFDLHELGFVKLRERLFFEGSGHEFFCQLSRTGTGPTYDRLTLANLALREAEC